MSCVVLSLLLSSPGITLPSMRDLAKIELPKMDLQLNADALARMGNVQTNSRGMEQDYTHLFQRYLSAAQQGEVDAQYSVAVAYERGLGVKQDAAEALKWYRLSAENGYAPAQKSMGEAYYQGKMGLSPDVLSSQFWYKKASSNPNYDVKSMLNRLQ